MKKIFATFVLLAAGMVILPLDASAQTYTTRRVTRNGRTTTIRVYTNTQNRRYRTNGINSRERARLARERMRYSRTARRATRDGVITNREARKLNRQSNRYVRSVRRARNN